MNLNIYISLAITLYLFSSEVNCDEGKSSDGKNPVVVSIQQGHLQGIRLKSRRDNEYYGFLGVPYAKAGIRFGAPQEPDSWDGIRPADEFAPRCLQYATFLRRVTGAEDCLTLNVYSKKLDGKSPVIVEIHGGGFQAGSGSLHEAKYLMDEDIILVSIQYRLGALGFLNIGDSTVPGNNGLRDQSAALKWVQKNIHKFGGDPKRVTILGLSAGGASVHYQMLSPMSKGLFVGGISQSGTALNPWAFQKNPRKYALLLAEKIGCTKATNQEIVDCLRTKPVEDIVFGQMSLSGFPQEFDFLSMLFCPSLEEGLSPDKFLAETPYKLIERGEIATKVPWIAGVTRDEGAFYITGIVENDTSIEIFNKDWKKMLPNILYFENSADPSEHNGISENIWKFYFNRDKITKDEYLQLGRVFGDRFFVTGVSRAIKLHGEKNHFPVYPYIFSHAGEHSVTLGLLGAKQAYGVSHTDDLKYIFNGTFKAPEYHLNTEEGKFSEKFVKLLVSFARDLKPTSPWGLSWEPLKITGIDDNIPWYDIDTDAQILSEDPFKERTDFWEILPLKEMSKEDATFDSASKDEL